ncbi:thiol-disulfide oxidoreductase DCC family protein [Pseudomaricurvus sp.]|uniref:thiol-disulfide oxidoreductase DCC family protein n=1 Tax=Pseudomaricurvus sp. TaxID=2004510 RepID=UPI003F6C4BC3
MSINATAKLTVFYDGQCPLCAQEMQALTKRDTHQRLQLMDIWHPEFASRYPEIDPAAANRVLHAVDDTGHLLLGLDVTARAWSLVGVTRYNCLRWPIIKPVADIAYRLFAKHRYRLSRLLTGKARLCDADQCSPRSK